MPTVLSFFLILLAGSNFDHNARECDFGIVKKKQTKQKQNKKQGGWGWQCSSQSLVIKSPVHCGNPEDDMQTIDTCIPVVHALFFPLIDIFSAGFPLFSITIAETKSV